MSDKTKQARDLESGDRFRHPDKPKFLTCEENCGPHPMYGHIIRTAERGQLTMPSDFEMIIEAKC